MKKIVIQSIWLVFAVVISSTLVPGYIGSIIIGLIFGLIPFLYLKKHSKNEILKINFLSSLIVLVILLIIYGIFYFYLGGNNGIIQGDEISPTVQNVLNLINMQNLLLSGICFIILFNVPSLIYFFFGKTNK